VNESGRYAERMKAFFNNVWIAGKASLHRLKPTAYSLLIVCNAAAGQSSAGLSVRSEISPGPYLVGQGIELGVAVVATGERPRIEPPVLTGAIAWPIGTDVNPIRASGIGSVVAAENRFVTRFRIVATRSGSLEVPAIRVRTKDQSVRTQPRRLTIQPVPVEGRPAVFLGGVGRSALEAEAIPNVVRVGQELEFRVKVTGPAAWGMTDRPILKRFEGLAIRPRIEPKPDVIINEPPSRTFVYRLRPEKAGEAVLPPVAIAWYDPAQSRYITRVTASVPVRVVAVASFNPATIDEWASIPSSGRFPWTAWIVRGFSAVSLLAAFGLLALVRRRRRRVRLQGPAAARQYASGLAQSLELDKTASPATSDRSEQLFRDAARLVSEELIEYLRLGIGRPPGALTPDEAIQGVCRLTYSDDLGTRAGRLIARCDRVQYGHGHFAAEHDARELIEDARGLFRVLGRVKISRRGDR
jgi:hypothetical protein